MGYPNQRAFMVDGKAVGRLVEDRDGRWAFAKRVKTRNHLRQFNAWAVNEDHLAAAEAEGAVRVLLIDEHEVEYRATIATIRRHGFRLPRYTADQQYALGDARWNVLRPGDAVQIGLGGEMFE